jgi:signal transduction histidine kinase
LKKTDVKPNKRDVLASIGRKAAEGSGLEEIIGSIFSDLRRIIPCDRLDIGLVEEDGLRVVIRSVAADYEPLHAPAGYTIDVPGSFCQQLLETGTPFISNTDEQMMSFENHEFSDLLAGEGIHSQAVVPVAVGDKILGILISASREPVSYTGHHVSLLEETAKLLRYPVEKTYQADLIEGNYRAYMEMLSFVSHELRSPISSIITLTQTLAEGYYGKLEERQRDILQRVIKKAEYLHAMSSQYLNLSRFESSMMELQLRLVDFIDDIVDPVIEILMPQIDERKMKLEREYRDSVFPVRCDPDLVQIVMINLLSNGIKYGNRGGILRITVEKGFKKFLVSVWNEGPGFSEREKNRLFKKFSRLQAAELVERKGSGIGLYVSWKIVQIHCGSISAESEQGAWARFTVELPQYQDLCIIE